VARGKNRGMILQEIEKGETKNMTLMCVSEIYDLECFNSKGNVVCSACKSSCAIKDATSVAQNRASEGQ